MDKIDPIIQGWGAGACQSRGFLGSLEPEPESLQKKQEPEWEPQKIYRHL